MFSTCKVPHTLNYVIPLSVAVPKSRLKKCAAKGGVLEAAERVLVLVLRHRSLLYYTDRTVQYLFFSECINTQRFHFFRPAFWGRWCIGYVVVV
jgi:hypothetical protein